MTYKMEIMLDSGAFSAWRQEDPIDLDEYIAYIKRHRHLLDSYVSLDTIPGERGKMDNSQAAIKKSAEASYRNHLKMKDAGLSPIPVFHQGEEFTALVQMLEDGEECIGISPYLRANHNDVLDWMDDCFTIVTDPSGKPLVKTHGFGATSQRIIMEYPWHSVDSTTWIIAAGYGRVKIPLEDSETGEYNYSAKADFWRVSEAKSNSGKSSDHLDDQPEAVITAAEKFFKSRGMTRDEIRKDWKLRSKLLIDYLLALEERHTTQTFGRRKASFILRDLERSIRKLGKPGLQLDPRVLFALNPSNQHQNTLLTESGVTRRLLSYYAVRQMGDKFDMEEYVEKGYTGEMIDFSKVAPRAYKSKRAEPPRGIEAFKRA